MSDSVTPQIVAHQAPLSVGTETLFLLPALQKQQLGFFLDFLYFCPEFAWIVHARSYV